MTRDEFETWRDEYVRAHAARGDRHADAVRRAIEGTATDVRIRRAGSLVAMMHGDRLKVVNFVTAQAFACRPAAVALLASLETWSAATALIARFPAERRLAQDVGRLVELGAIVAEGSAYAAIDERYRAEWEWGEVAGLFHFGIKDVAWATEPEHWDRIMENLTTRPSPPLYETNESFTSVTKLPEAEAADALFATMRARRSVREFSAEKLPLDTLGRILHSGLALTALSDAERLGILPLKITPSGGARNPYEGYVLAVNVEGLAQGVHHYSGFEHSLGLVSDEPFPPPASFLAELQWVNDAAAVVFLVANYPRTAWKYDHPVAYRTVLIEAGHIAQNMLLAATALDVAATPVAALCGSIAETALGLDPIRQGVVHTVVLGRPRDRDARAPEGPARR